MKNTGIIYESTEQTPATMPAFAGLLPPLTDEQYAALEADILQNGCYSPIIVNENTVIIDGYHRYEICGKHGIPYRMAVFAFEDDLEAQRWALDTQKARRKPIADDLKDHADENYTLTKERKTQCGKALKALLSIRKNIGWQSWMRISGGRLT